MRWMQSPPPKRILKDEIVYQACPNKNEMLAILRTANGDKFFQQDLVTCQHLPTWHDVTSLYGGGPSSSAVAGMMTTTFSTPYVLGLETCQAYCDMSTQQQQPKPTIPISTQPDHQLFHLLVPTILGPITCYNYCVSMSMCLQQKKGALVSALRKYHGPNMWRWKYRNVTLTKERLSDLEHEAIFPIVVVHNPYQWLASMCKESYFATWNRTHKQCPLLAPSPQDMANGYSGIYHCPKSTQDLGERFPSLQHYWSNFYQQCWYDSKPCVLVRYEDLVFHAEKVIRQIADCEGLLMNPRGFYYMNQASKYMANWVISPLSWPNMDRNKAGKMA